MSGKYLLDTNIVIALFSKDMGVIGELEKGGEIFIPSVVIGELYYGAEKSLKREENKAVIKKFISDNIILSCTKETAVYYGEVKNSLRKKGRPIPENDIWISALAIQHKLILVTRDIHFKDVNGLKIVSW